MNKPKINLPDGVSMTKVPGGFLYCRGDNITFGPVAENDKIAEKLSDFFSQNDYYSEGSLAEKTQDLLEDYIWFFGIHELCEKEFPPIKGDHSLHESIKKAKNRLNSLEELVNVLEQALFENPNDDLKTRLKAVKKKFPQLKLGV